MQQWQGNNDNRNEMEEENESTSIPRVVLFSGGSAYAKHLE